MKILAYVCCSHHGCDAKELTEVSATTVDHRPALDAEKPKGWEYQGAFYDCPSAMYCPKHRKTPVQPWEQD